MPIRNRHKVGSYLMLDDESGFVHYREEMVRLWDGTWRHRDNFETRQPQEFVRARNDPRALRHIRPEPLGAKPVNTINGYVDDTTIEQKTGPASHLFRAGIGSMIIEGIEPFSVFEVA